MKKIFPVLLIAFLIVAGSIVVACSPASTPPADDAEVAAIRAYADPATQTTLEGLSENNLAKYTQNANAQFKAAVTPDILDKTYGQINSQLGSYVSMTFLRTEKQDAYVIVHYKVKFARGEVGVRMVFDKDHLVAGQWFE